MNTQSRWHPPCLIAPFVCLLVSFIFPTDLSAGLKRKCKRAPELYESKVTQTSNQLGELYGTISGQVVPLVGATVSLMLNEEVIDRVLTDASGGYRFKHVNPGCYYVKVSKEGYRTRIIKEVPVKNYRIAKADCYLPKLTNRNMDKYTIIQNYEPEPLFINTQMKVDDRVLERSEE